MSKKRKTQPFGHDSGDDKPDYAADLFRGERRPKKREVAEESVEISVRDRLGTGMIDKLAALKAQMKEAAPPQKRSVVKPVPVTQAGKPAPVDDGNTSFADLFDPQEKDDSSFEELLQSSKLDWRSFKE